MQKTDRNIRSSYKDYKKKSENPVELQDFVELCNNYHKFLMDKVLSGYEVTLPARLGTFQIVGTKKKIKFDEDGNPMLPPNWPKTKALWAKCKECKEKKQIVYHTNDHSNGVVYKLHWSKKRVLIKNKSLFSFRLTRHNKRAIHSRIMNGTEYLIKA